MNKRSAVAVAGGVAGALISGLAGYSVRVQHQPARPQADPAGAPIVKRQVRTITIHKKPKPAHVSGSQGAIGAPPPMATVVVHRPTTFLPATRAAPTSVHRTGASAVAGGESEHESDGGGDGGGD